MVGKIIRKIKGKESKKTGNLLKAVNKKSKITDSNELICLIEKEAYNRYLSRGGGHGLDQEDWYQAEKQVLKTRGKK